MKIAPQKSQPVNFTFARNEPGRYTINIAGLSSSFEIKPVIAGNEELPSALSMPIMATIIAGGLMIIIMVIVFLARH